MDQWPERLSKVVQRCWWVICWARSSFPRSNAMDVEGQEMVVAGPEGGRPASERARVNRWSLKDLEMEKSEFSLASKREETGT